MILSKSEYMMYLKHPAWLWVKKHAKDLIPPVSPELQARFDEGNQFEPYAEALFPNLIRLGFNDFQSYLNLPFETQQAWDDGATVIAQGRYESGSITCISDVVRKDGTEYILTEIKSSTRKKEDHIYDLAFQRVVLEASGFPVKKCEIGHVNSNYVRNGEIDPKGLVAFTDVTEEVQKKLESTKARINQALAIANSPNIPDTGPELTRLGAYADWMEIRLQLTPPLPENSIHFLPSMNAKIATKLSENNINLINEITDRSLFNKNTKKYLRAVDHGTRTVDKTALNLFLNKIKFPVYYFDYETSGGLLPIWDGTRPYQQVPFQYSLHIQKEHGSEIEHKEYLHRNSENPMPKLLEALRKDVGDEGTILSWHASFEIQQNEAMAEMYPDYASFLNNMNQRMIDLKEPFADETVIDPGFKGSASIKDVLPVFKPELSYSDLDIQKGDAASRLWKEVTIEKPNSSNGNKVYSDLIDYCKRDTWAMVEIHRELEKMVKQ